MVENTQTPNNESGKEEAKMTTTTDKKTTFADLLRRYEQQARTPHTDAYTTALTDLATAIAYSVVKKCIDVSQNRTLIDIRRSIARDTATLDKIDYASQNAYATGYNDDGDMVQVTADRDLSSALDRLLRQTLGDGLDIVNDAVVAILDATRNADTAADGWLERPYTVRRLKRKVWIKVEDSADGWETVDTTPIRETYQAVRRAINASRAMQTDPRNGYTYIADMVADADSDNAETIYRRMPKYADIGGHVMDYNGRDTAYTADDQTAADMDDIVARLDLTARQTKVLQLRLCGYGKKAIATYLGISASSVATLLRRIRDRATEIGLVPD